MSFFLNILIAFGIVLCFCLVLVTGVIATMSLIILLKKRSVKRTFRNLGIKEVSTKVLLFCFTGLFCLALVTLYLPPQGRLYMAMGAVFLMVSYWLCVGIGMWGQIQQH